MSTVDSQFDPFGRSTVPKPSESDVPPTNSTKPTALTTEEILRFMEKDAKLSNLASTFRSQQQSPEDFLRSVTSLEDLDPFPSTPSTEISPPYPPGLSPTVASLGLALPLAFPSAANVFSPFDSYVPIPLDDSLSSSAIFAQAGLFSDESSSPSAMSTSTSTSTMSSSSLRSDPSSSPTKSYSSIAASAITASSAPLPPPMGFSPKTSQVISRPVVPSKFSNAPPAASSSASAPNSSSAQPTSSNQQTGALPRNSRNIPIGKDYLDHGNKDVECGMANGLCVMTHPNVAFETSLSQFLPLVNEVAEQLLLDLKESSAQGYYGSRKSPGRVSEPRAGLNQNRFGAVCRCERSRVHYYFHVYDAKLPVLKLFERLMLHPLTSTLDTISRIYPVTVAAHPEVDFAQQCIKLITSHPMTMKVSNAASSSSSSASGPISPVKHSLSLSASNVHAAASNAHRTNRLTIGLALESHRAAEFARELSASIASSLPFIDVVERNPMHCDLMLSSCYFNSIFLTTLWEPINTNDLNNYRPSEMKTWALLHPYYTPRTPFATGSGSLLGDFAPSPPNRAGSLFRGGAGSPPPTGAAPAAPSSSVSLTAGSSNPFAIQSKPLIKPANFDSEPLLQTSPPGDASAFRRARSISTSPTSSNYASSSSMSSSEALKYKNLASNAKRRRH